eukprot:2445961-Prymnesium_polylepis.1
MVRTVEPMEEGGWRLTSKQGDALGEFDWLVVSSSTVAHPRWRGVFGGEPPMADAAAALGDASLTAALERLAQLRSLP